MAKECIDEIDLNSFANAHCQIFDAAGMNPAGQHACELVNIFFPAGFWVTGIGDVRITLESTLQNEAAIADNSPVVLDRVLPAHDRLWIPLAPDCVSADTDKDCDEYPYASSSQGGPVNFQFGTVHVDLIDRDSNQGEGNALAAFYGSAQGCGVPPNLGPGSDSMYVVVPIPVADTERRGRARTDGRGF